MKVAPARTRREDELVMDGERFDQLIRAIGTDASRRRVLKGLSAGVVGGLTGMFRAKGISAQGGGCRPAGHPCEGGQSELCCQPPESPFVLECIEGSGSGAAERCCLPGSEVCGTGGNAICCPEEARCNAQDECICPNDREFCGFLCCPVDELCADPETGACVECFDDSDCSAADCEECSGGECVTTCTDPEFPLCDGEGGCICDADPNSCTGGTFCCADGTCQECCSDSDCDEANCEECSGGECVTTCTDPAFPFCDGSGNCVECLDDTDCDQPNCEVCFNGTCAVCPNGGTCDGQGTCEDNTCPPRDGKERKLCAGADGKKDKCCPANPQQPCGRTRSGTACCGGKTSGKCRIVEA
jgi:hypothetical protein